MSLSKVSPFYSSAPSMFTDSQPKLGTDYVPFYIDLALIQTDLGDLLCPKYIRNGQNYSVPTFQVFKKDKCGTFEKYQQLRIGDCEFKKFYLLKNDLLNGDWEIRENPAQFEKNPKMEDVLQQCHKAREISIGVNHRLNVTFIQYVQDNPASVYVQIRLFCRKESNEFKQVTYVSYKMKEFKELIENLKDFANIEQCTFQ